MNTEKVWFSGRRWIGPDKTFKKFSSSAHYIDLEDVSVFAKPDDVSLRYGFIIMDLFFNVKVETLNDIMGLAIVATSNQIRTFVVFVFFLEQSCQDFLLLPKN